MNNLDQVSKITTWRTNKVEAAPGTACPMLYPMYAMSIDNVLQLQKFQPHQEMLEAGKLTLVTPGVETIFVSHQWLSYQHPDPEGMQLRCLQRVLQRLASGEVDVENDFKQQIYLQERGRRPKGWWKKKMANMHIWLDFMCMPQLSSVQDERACEVQLPSSPGNKRSFVQDHSHCAGDEAEQLLKAVESLPAYIEMSRLMLVLVPTDKHRDRLDEVVDWCSWRRRGW